MGNTNVCKCVWNVSERTISANVGIICRRRQKMNDPVNHPAHYTSHPSGVECITITEHMGFNLGNAIKYIWRADEKGNATEDLKKAAWYVAREIKRREKIENKS